MALFGEGFGGGLADAVAGAGNEDAGHVVSGMEMFDRWEVGYGY